MWQLSGHFAHRQANLEVAKIQNPDFFLLGLKYTLRTCFESKKLFVEFLSKAEIGIADFSRCTTSPVEKNPDFGFLPLPTLPVCVKNGHLIWNYKKLFPSYLQYMDRLAGDQYKTMIWCYGRTKKISKHYVGRKKIMTKRPTSRSKNIKMLSWSWVRCWPPCDKNNFYWNSHVLVLLA